MASYETAPESSPAHHDRMARAVRGLTLTIALVFIVVGLAGFVPGLTVNADDLAWAGHHSGAELLGVFQVSILHNLVHLVFGLAGILMSGTLRRTTLYLLVGGVVYAVVWLYGVLVDHRTEANFLPLNTADNWLHLGLAIVMVALGLWALSLRTGPRGSAGEPPARRAP